MGLLAMPGQTTEVGPWLGRPRATTRRAASMPGPRHSLARRRCRQAAEAVVGVRGAERLTEVMIRVRTELKAEVAVEAEVVPQVGILAVAQERTLVAEAPAGMDRTMVQIRCWPSFAP